MDDATLLRLSDLNLMEFNRDSARSTAGGIVHEEDGLLFFMPGHRLPVGAVGVMRTDPQVPAETVYERARAFFDGRGIGFTVWAAMHRDTDIARAMEAKGIAPFGDHSSPGMVIEQPVPLRPLPDGVRIDRVTTAAGVRDFAEISGKAYATYGMPPGIAEAQFADDAFWRASYMAIFVAYQDDRPLGTAMTLCSHGVGGVYWVGTVPEARGRGLAEACTRLATNEGFAHGAHFASLQASVMGEPIYRRMGYREITRYPWYVVM